MNTKSHLIFITVTIILFSCSKTNNYSITTFDYINFHKEQKLTGEKIFLDGLKDSRQMVHYSNYIICEEIKSKNLLSVFNLQTKKKEFSFLSKGRGPNEMLDVSDLRIYENKKELLVFDIISHQYNIYKLDTLLQRKNLKPFLSGEINNNPYGEEFIRINDTTFIGSGLSSRLYFYNANGEIIKKIGDYSYFDNNEKDIWLTQIYRGHIEYNYQTGKIAFLNKLTDVIELFSNDTLEKVIEGPDHFNAVYKIVSAYGGFALAHRSEKTHVAYNNSWSDDQFIFTLYSGQQWGKVGFHYSNAFVFSWEGEPLINYNLDIPISMISVDTENKTIYGLNVENEVPFIVKYKF